MGPIPAKYFWPGFIVGLLLLSVGFGALTVWSALSDGGPKIIEAKPLPTQPAATSTSPVDEDGE